MKKNYSTVRLALATLVLVASTNLTNAQVINTVAGNGTAGYTGDGAAATAAELYYPQAVAFDAAGNMYIADSYNNCIREVNTAGIISTVAGNGNGGYNGDGISATAAELSGPEGVAVDAAGNIYIADASNNRIRMVNTSGIISTIAGDGAGGYNGDGMSASGAELDNPHTVSVDAAGNIYIADYNNYRVREINTGGIINTVAGNGNVGYTGDGGSATLATLVPNGVGIDASGNIYVADANSNVIRKVNTSGIISTIAGNDTAGYNGDHILAIHAQLNSPQGVGVDASGNIYIADFGNSIIRKVNSSDTITTFAGMPYYASYWGDGSDANIAALQNPIGVAFDASGNVYIADYYNNRVRKVFVHGPVITSQPQFSNSNICNYTSVAVGLTATGTGLTYQWQVDSNYGSWVTLSNAGVYSGVTTDSLKISQVSLNYSYTPQYRCIVTSAGISDTSGTVNLYINPLPYVTFSGVPDSICPGAQAQVIALASGGERIKPHGNSHYPVGPNYAYYYWKGTADSTDTLTVYPKVTTTYTAVVTQYGCALDTSITVNVDRTKVLANAFPSSSVCAGNTVTLSGSGGNGSYSWSGPSTVNNNEGFSPTSTGTYTVSGVDGMGCVLQDTVTISVLPTPTITVTSSGSDTVCFGSQIALTASGATSYNWSGGISNSVPFTATSSTTYFVTGTDANGCTGSAKYTTIVAPLPIVTGDAKPASVCAGTPVTLTGNGASTYSWSGGVTNAVPFVPVASGTYTLTGTSTFGCTNTAIVAVTVNPLPTIGASAFPSATLCQGSSVALFGSGGASYAWSGGVNNGVSFTPSSSAKYIVTGIDANGCTNTDSVMVTVSPKVVPTITSLNTTCGLKNGVANVTASNGTPPYTYSWSTFPVSTNSSIDSLAPGTYVVTVSDSANCSSSAAVSIASSTAPILSVSTTNSNCGTIGTGSATVSVIGGTPPYRYLWNNGDTLPNDFNLKAATYIITVTDVNGCSTFAPGIVSNNNGPKITVTSQGNVKCFGSATGSIAVVVSGGTAPYSYNWSNGATTASISGLYAGPYQLTITDADSCTSVQNFIISQPASGVSITSTTTKADCGSSDGSAMASATGGVAPYTYAWSNGVSSASNTGIGAGVYVITITDANGCVDSSTVAVSDKTGPALALSLSGDATCGAGGLLSVSASGANPPYTYAWSTGSTNTSISNVPAGSYNVTVTDSHGCISTADTSVMEAIPPALSICMVTVDPDSSKHNYVIWDKSTAHKIASYNIYKESTVAGVYFQVASVPFSALGTYEDLLSDPNVRSWRYEISQVDSCGNESPLSQPHKTMHLTVNQGLGGAVNLIWDNYQGLAFSTYYIYRDTVGSNLTVIDSVPNNIFTYTDPTPPHSVLPLLYRIGISNPGGCTPSVTAINYNASKSNTGNIKVNGSVSVQNIASPLSSLQVYPNPSTGLFTVALTLPNTNEDLQLTVINALGQELVTKSYSRVAGQFSAQLDLSTIAKGVYFLKASYHNTNTYTKIVLQ